jgi:hypothetical protein
MTIKETKSAEGDASRAVLWGLTSLDAEIRKSQGGVPGSGIYGLLDMLAGQFLGVPRGSYPSEPPPVDTPPEAQAAESDFERKQKEEPVKHDPPPAAKPHAPAPNHRR